MANDNDFSTRNGFMKLADGTFQQYDSVLNNDTVFLAYRVTIAIPEPTTVRIAAVLACGPVRRRR